MARKAKASPASTRSIRVEDKAWDRARQRAENEGTTVSAAAADLVEGYARGVYDLPRTHIVREFPGGK